MASLLQKGIAEAKAGNKGEAYRFLKEATRERASAENAWLWLAGVVEREAERLFCLENALLINPDNEPARHGAETLRKQGIQPAALPDAGGNAIETTGADVPGFLQSKRRAKPAALGTGRSKPDEPRPDLLSEYQPIPQQTLSVDSGALSGQSDLDEMYRLATTVLSRHIPAIKVIDQLVGQGLSQGTARKVVADTQRALKKTRSEKYRRRMMRGFVFTMAATSVTCAAYAFAGNLFTTYLICWGAIILGVIDFIWGMAGWMANR